MENFEENLLLPVLLHEFLYFPSGGLAFSISMTPVGMLNRRGSAVLSQKSQSRVGLRDLKLFLKKISFFPINILESIKFQIKILAISSKFDYFSKLCLMKTKFFFFSKQRGMMRKIEMLTKIFLHFIKINILPGS